MQPETMRGPGSTWNRAPSLFPVDERTLDAERFLDLFEDALGVRVLGLPEGAIQLAEELLLLLGEIGRNHGVDPHAKVAPAILSQVRHTLPFNAELLAVLG